jgi:hypothetical protein
MPQPAGKPLREHWRFVSHDGLEFLRNFKRIGDQ